MTVGSWLASCAACSQSGTTIDRWDPAETTHPLWAQRFSEFQTTGAFVSGTGTTSEVSKVLNRFVPGEPWRVWAQNMTYGGDFAKISVEFFNATDLVSSIAQIELKPPGSQWFKNVVHVSAMNKSTVEQPTFGTYPNVDGVLIADLDGIRYTPNPLSGADTSAFFFPVNLSSVTRLRIKVSAKTGYTAALTLAASGSVQIMGRLGGVVRDASGNPAARAVRAIHEGTGDVANTIVKSVTSDATTGAYSLPTAAGGAHTVIAYPAAGENLPALALRGVVPI